MEPTIAPAPNAEILKRMNFEQITGDEECDSCLFLKKEGTGREQIISLADTSTGIILAMKVASWLELLQKIRNGEII